MEKGSGYPESTLPVNLGGLFECIHRWSCKKTLKRPNVPVIISYFILDPIRHKRRYAVFDGINS